MKNIKIVIMMMLASSVFLGGCAATKQARGTLDASGFLNEYKSELRPGEVIDGVQQVKLVYVKPGLNLAPYKKVLFSQITIWDDPSDPMTAEDRNDLLILADSVHAMAYEKLSKEFEMVDEFGPDTIRMQVAIIHGQRSKVGLAFISKVIPQARALNTLWSFASGKPAFTGSVQMESKFTDAATGELLAAGADERVGGLKLMDKNIFSTWGDAQNAFTYWADLLLYRMCKYGAGKTRDCVPPKA